jgi:hypothetical protein
LKQKNAKFIDGYLVTIYNINGQVCKTKVNMNHETRLASLWMAVVVTYNITGQAQFLQRPPKVTAL